MSRCVPSGLALLCLLSVATVTAGEGGNEAGEAATEAQIRKWIAELDHDEYRVRREATRRLREAGPKAFGALVDAAATGTLEASVRSLDVFERAYLSARDERADAAEDALDQLIASENDAIATRARQLADDQYEVRAARALKHVERLGGAIERSQESSGQRVVQINGRIVVQPSAVAGAVQGVRLIPGSWKGTAEDLKYVKRLTRLKHLYLVDGAVTRKQWDELEVALPDVQVQGRGKAFLGIGGDPNAGGGGCLVLSVTPGGAAGKAGIQPGDLIVGFGDEKVEGFDALIKLIANHNPGDKVVAHVQRNSPAGPAKIDLPVTLGGWADANKPTVPNVPNLPPPIVPNVPNVPIPEPDEPDNTPVPQRDSDDE